MSTSGITRGLRRLLGIPVSPAVEPETEATRPCPYCKRPVSRGATVCIHCERELAPLMSYGEFARRFGSPHSGGPPHGEVIELRDSADSTSPDSPEERSASD